MRHPTVPVSSGIRAATAVLLAASLALPATSLQAREANRTLKLYFGHTGERGEFTFKRGGRYDRGELQRINNFLRDWRKNEPAKMDPALLDLIWEIQRETGSREYIHVVSAYRSPATNESLRKRSSGVAKNSQHTQGKAMDFFIPGVPLDKLRAIAMKKQGGGVGYYPKSGSPFVHADTGSVRAWPRMSRQQLIALFPNGDTLHLPADGKPLPGYERALARGKPTSTATTTVAYLDEEETASPSGRKGVGGWLKRVFDGGADQVEDDAAAGLPIPTPPQPAPVAAEPEILVGALENGVDARLPRARPGSDVETALAELRPTADPQVQNLATLAFAPLPRTRPDPTMLAESLSSGESSLQALNPPGEDAIAAFLNTQEPLPAPEPVREVASAAPPAAEGPAADYDPVQLAFAAAEESRSASPADSAIIAAFAAGVHSPANSGQPAAQAAANAKASAPAPDEPGPIGVIFAATDLVSSASAAPSPSSEVDYGEAGDLLALATMPETQGQDAAALSMPTPEGAPGLYAHAATTKVEGLDGGPALPVDRFATASAEKTGSEGFFSKLFLSLVR